MGVDHNIRLGPYFECSYLPKEIFSTVRYCSVDKKHPTPGESAKFCSACGSPVTVDHIKTGRYTSDVDTWAVGTSLKDRLYCAHSMGGDFGEKNTHYWMPNLKWGGQEFRLEKYQEGAYPLTVEMLTEQLATFAAFFKNEIEVLRQHYIIIIPRWGLLAYCS